MLAPYVDAPTVRLVRDQISRFAAMMNEREWFAEALSKSADSYADLPGLLSRLGGRDVIFAFIESYGVTALYDARYSPVIGPRLDDFQARMDAAGLYVVSGKLVQNSLLFLGFSLNDWKFRVLFRLIMAFAGRKEIERQHHVGVQIDPEDHSIEDVERSKKYLAKYFGSANVNIYWGSSADFLAELREQLENTEEPAPVAAGIDLLRFG